jgi:hypothetical protein
VLRWLAGYRPYNKFIVTIDPTPGCSVRIINTRTTNIIASNNTAIPIEPKIRVVLFIPNPTPLYYPATDLLELSVTNCHVYGMTIE